jgi:hypothetical protein
MRKIFLVLFSLLASMSFALDLNSLKTWFTKFEITAELNYYVNEKLLVVSEQTTLNNGDIRFEVGYIFSALEYYLRDKNLKFESLEIDIRGVVYSTKDFGIKFDSAWIIVYLQIKKSDRQKMLSDFLNAQFKNLNRLSY